MTTKVADVHVFDKLGRVPAEEATAGDIAALVGLEEVEIGDTVSDPEVRSALPRVAVDEPTLQMVFSINTSPFAGREGKYVTSQHLARPAEKRAGAKRRAACRAGRQRRFVSGLRPRRAAPLRAHRNDAPRGLRALDRQAARRAPQEKRRHRRAVRKPGRRSAARQAWAR